MPRPFRSRLWGIGILVPACQRLKLQHGRERFILNYFPLSIWHSLKHSSIGRRISAIRRYWAELLSRWALRRQRFALVYPRDDIARWFSKSIWRRHSRGYTVFLQC